MELLKTDVSDISEDRKRITGFVKYDDGHVDEYWYEYPAHFEISNTGNPWLAALLPMAATIGEDLIINLPVDPHLVNGAEDIMRFWSDHNVGTSVIKIKPEGGEYTSDLRPTDSASFFSSGLDAFYTAYSKPRTKYKILIHGFDLSITKEDEFAAHCKRISKVIDKLGEEAVVVKTNIRHTRWKETRWQAVSHGAALSSIGLLFEKHFAEIFVPSSMSDYADLYCWGSHPLTDPLYSTSRTHIITDGDGIGRIEKVEYISDHDIALEELHVCIRGKDGSGQDEVNCSHCEKCYRTMLALDVVGCLDKCKLFDLSKFNYSEIPYIYITDAYTAPEYHEMAEAAIKKGNHELANGIYKAINRSKWIQRLEIFNNVPILWKINHNMMQKSIY